MKEVKVRQDTETLRNLGVTEVINAWVTSDEFPVDQYAIADSIRIFQRGKRWGVTMKFPNALKSPELSCIGRGYRYAIASDYEVRSYLSTFPKSASAPLLHSSLTFPFKINPDQIALGVGGVTGHDRFACYTPVEVDGRKEASPIAVVNELSGGRGELKITENEFGINRVAVSMDLIGKPIVLANVRVIFRSLLVTSCKLISIPEIKLYILGREGRHQHWIHEFAGKPVPLTRDGRLPRGAEQYIMENHLVDGWEDLSRLVFAENCRLLRREQLKV